MGKIITVTSEEIRKEWTPEKLKEWAKNLPSFPDDDPDAVTDEDIATGRVRPTGGRGFASYLEHINRNGAPQARC